jgi:hypothetical protein
MAINKRKYLDDDTREELKSVKGIVFNSEEELNAKLDEIHRKRNDRKISRLMRVFGFILAVILFVASFDVFYESSFFGAIFEPVAYKHSMDSLGAAKNNGYVIEKSSTEYYVEEGGDVIDIITAAEYAQMCATDPSAVGRYFKVYKYNIKKKYSDGSTTETLYSPDINMTLDSRMGQYFKDSYAELVHFDKNTPDSKVYDDPFWFGNVLVATLHTLVLLTLGALLIYLAVFMIKDVVDIFKMTFIGASNTAAELAETATRPLKKKREKEEEPPQ